MDKSVHYFWAVQLPEHIKQSIQNEMIDRQHVFLFKRWVHMDDYHITLAFLGSMNKQQQHTVIDFVSKAIKNEKMFNLQIQGLNIFGNKKSPRIFWGSVNHEDALVKLQTLVHQKCQEAGFSLETRPYQPHITLARNWIGKDEFDMELLEKYNPFSTKPLSFLAEKIVLYKTNLEQTPKYEPIVTFTLVN